MTLSLEAEALGFATMLAVAEGTSTGHQLLRHATSLPMNSAGTRRRWPAGARLMSPSIGLPKQTGAAAAGNAFLPCSRSVRPPRPRPVTGHAVVVQLLARPGGLFADGVGARDDSDIVVGAANPVQVRVVVERTAQMHHQPGDRVRNIVVRASSHVR